MNPIRIRITQEEVNIYYDLDAKYGTRIVFLHRLSTLKNRSCGGVFEGYMILTYGTLLVFRYHNINVITHKKAHSYHNV